MLLYRVPVGYSLHKGLKVSPCGGGEIELANQRHRCIRWKRYLQGKKAFERSKPLHRGTRTKRHVTRQWLGLVYWTLAPSRYLSYMYIVSHDYSHDLERINIHEEDYHWKLTRIWMSGESREGCGVGCCCWLDCSWLAIRRLSNSRRTLEF